MLIFQTISDCKDEIIAICHRAETDVQMEFSLQNCEEVWISKVFDLKPVMRKRLNVSICRVQTSKQIQSVQVLHLVEISFTNYYTAQKIYWFPIIILLTMLQILTQGDYDSNARIELAKSTRDSQVVGSFSEGKSRAFSITSKDSKITDQNSYKVITINYNLLIGVVRRLVYCSNPARIRAEASH